MKCETCGCDYCEPEITEVVEDFGQPYANNCYPCATEKWHDENLAPSEDENE